MSDQPAKPGRLTLADVCDRYLLQTKWLIAPSHRVGHQWTEKLVRNQHSAVNLRPTTLLRLALEVVGGELTAGGLTLANRSVGTLFVSSHWDQLNPDGYLGQLDQSAELSASVLDSLLAIRLAGCDIQQIEQASWESREKAADIQQLLASYERFLVSQRLVDEADVLSLAARRLHDEPTSLSPESLILIPERMRVKGLESRFFEALPAARRIEIEHPAGRESLADLTTDISLLGRIGSSSEGLEAGGDGSVQIFRAVGEINEVREILRRTLSENRSLDNTEILHTDTDTYVPLILATAMRYSSEDVCPVGVPVTFAEGIPTTVSRPGRALVGWLRWIREGYPQRLLVEMIAEGLLDPGGNDDHSFGYLARVFRRVAIGLGANEYLRRIDQQIDSVRSGEAQGTKEVAESDQRKLTALQALRKLVHKLLALSEDVVSGNAETELQAAEKFVNSLARRINEIDRYSTDALLEQIADQRTWLERLDFPFDAAGWLTSLPSVTRVMGSGPLPGHMHVSHVDSGGHTGRSQTFLIGLDDRRFPGAAMQDPVLLDRERFRLSPELTTSASHLEDRIERLADTLSRLTGTVTLSWSCQDLGDDREMFPASVVLSAFRLVSGQSEADLGALNTATSPPASFAPETAGKALDETERWLWRLSDERIQGTDQVVCVESFFPHLSSGSSARMYRVTEFGSFSGYVPQAGRDLNPFAADGPVMSASALETAGRCPLAFFFRNGLKLYPPDELEIDPDRWIDAAQFGSLLHEVFRRFMEEVSSGGLRPKFDRDQNRLAEILQEAVQQWRREVPPPNENAFRRQCGQLIQTARIFLEEEEQFCQTSQPRFFEVALGLKPDGPGTLLDDEQPALINLPSGRTIRARGQVDRVDETGGHRYSVWDYKTGSGYGYDRNDPFRQGRRVQSVLYLQMIEAAILARLDNRAVVERFGYFFPGVRAHGLRVEWDSGTLARGLSVLEGICRSIETGAFPATDDPDDCRYCDYRSICGNVDLVTGCSKSLLDQDSVATLNDFRGLRRD